MNNSYHLHVGISKRKNGCSAIKTGAYVAGLKLTDATTGETHNYSGRTDVELVRVLSPVELPTHLQTPEGFCEAVERREKRKDAQLFRLFNVALPKELPRETKILIAILFCQHAFLSRGMSCMLAIHDIDGKNPHFHVMVTMRRFDPKIGDFGKKDRGWNKKPILKAQRKEWAWVCNEAFLEMGRPDLIVSCESYKSRGISKPRQKHMGSYVHRLWLEDGIILEKSAQYVADTESKKLLEIEREIATVEAEILRLQSEDISSDYDLPQEDLAEPLNKILAEETQIPSLEPTQTPEDKPVMKIVEPRDSFKLLGVSWEQKPPVVIEIPAPIKKHSTQTELERRIKECIDVGGDLREILTPDQIIQLGYSRYQLQFEGLGAGLLLNNLDSIDDIDWSGLDDHLDPNKGYWSEYDPEFTNENLALYAHEEPDQSSNGAPKH